MERGGIFAVTGIIIWVLFTWACFSTEGSVDETAREVLTVRLAGFIVIIGIAFFFFIRNIRK